MSTWFDNAVIYHILTDRFAGCDPNRSDMDPSWTGGNFLGIKNRLDYLSELGIDAIWLSPVTKALSYHGYDVLDYHHIDPHLGSENDLKELVDAAHQNDIKVIIDFVPNHCSFEHPFFVDAINNPNSQFRDWFYFNEWPGEYLTFFGYTELPKLNLDYPPAREHIISSAVWLLETFDIDGFRLDHVPGASNDFWKTFIGKIKTISPSVITYGEIVIDGIPEKFIPTIKMDSIRNLYESGQAIPHQIMADAAQEYAGILDGALNFSFEHFVHKFVAGKISYGEFTAAVNEYIDRFPKHFKLPVFLDNHDRDRILFSAKNNVEKVMQAAKFQFSLNQPKIIYYGTEVGMTQDRPIKINSGNSHDDLQARQKMIWHQKDQNSGLLAFYKELIKNSKS